MQELEGQRAHVAIIHAVVAANVLVADAIPVAPRRFRAAPIECLRAGRARHARDPACAVQAHHSSASCDLLQRRYFKQAQQLHYEYSVFLIVLGRRCSPRQPAH